jgi:hypothetical protein
MEKVFLRIAGGEEGLAQSRLGREIAEMLQAEADDEAQRELDKVVFSEATCCGCTRFAWRHMCLYLFAWNCILETHLFLGAWFIPDRFDWCIWTDRHGKEIIEEKSKGHLRRCGKHDYWLKAFTMFYYSPMGLLVVLNFIFWTWCLCAPCALWCLRAPSRTGAVAPA